MARRPDAGGGGNDRRTEEKDGATTPDPGDEGGATSTYNRRDYMRFVGGGAAALVGIGAAGSAAAAEYETITVGAGEQRRFDLGSGDTLENTLIDVTADRADVHIRASGSGWTIRNVGIRGHIDVGDDSPGGDTNAQEGGYSQVMNLEGDGTVEHLYVGDGVEPGVDKSGLNVGPGHSGHIDMTEVNVGRFSTTCFYVSGFGREGTGGSMTIENSYVHNSSSAHVRPAGNVTLDNVTITNTNETVYLPRTFGGVDQPITSRGVWTSYDGPETVVRNCDIDVRQGNTCETPWDYSGPCAASAVHAADARVRLVDSQVAGSISGNVSRSNVGGNPDTAAPSGVPMTPVEGASGQSSAGGSGNGGDSGGSGDSGNGNGGEYGHTIALSGGTPDDHVEYEFSVSEALARGPSANSEDSVSDTTATGALGGGTDDYDFDGEVTDVTSTGEVTVTIDGSEVDPADLGGDGGSGDSGSDDEGDGSDESPDLSNTIVVSGGHPDDHVEYAFDVTQALELGPRTNSEDSVSGTTAEGTLGGWTDDYDFAGEVTDFSASGEVTVAINGEEIDPADLGGGDGSDDGDGDGGGGDGSDSGDGSDGDEGDGDDNEGDGDTPAPSRTISLSGGTPGDHVAYEFSVSEVLERGPGANSEDAVSGTTATGALGGGTDDYDFAGEVTAFTASGDVTVTVDGEDVDPADLGDAGGGSDSGDGSDGDEGNGDGNEGDGDTPAPSRTISLSGGTPGDHVAYEFSVSEVLERGPGANSEDSVSGTTATGALGGGTDDYDFAGEVTAFTASGDVTVTVDGEDVDPATLG